ncbi:MAG: host-nuclease inhibitor Gam family protein [Armatimonadota bacterium]|nr:host-nuclease inhibitor Gam family protein [bacterium]
MNENDATTDVKQEPFGFVTNGYLLEDDGRCPLCGTDLEPSQCGDWLTMGNLVKHRCLNPDCPYLNDENVRNVVNALINNGAAPLEAAKLTRDYTISDPKGFHIHDRESAGWLLKKLAKIDGRENDINAEVDARKAELQAEITALEERRTEMIAPYERDRIYLTTRYGGELEEWTKAELKGNKSKSIKLSYGDVGTKKSRAANVVDSELDTLVMAESLDNPDDPEQVFVNRKATIYKDAFFKWLSEHPDHERVRVDEDGTINLLADDSFLADGDEPEVIAHIAPAKDEFYIKPAMPVKGVA